jgi:hypothetical protein
MFPYGLPSPVWQAAMQPFCSKPGELMFQKIESLSS